MKELSGEERILRVLEKKETDRVPTFEWYIDKKVIEALSPGSDFEKFCYDMDIDAICVDCNFDKKILNNGLIQDEWGMIKKDTGESHPYPVDGPVRTLKDAQQYIPPDPHKQGRYDFVEKAIKEHSGKKAVILHLNDVLSIPSRLMPFNEFLMKLIDDPETIKTLVRMSVDINLEMAKEAKKRGIKIVYTGDDYAYNSGPIISPGKFRDIFFPELKRVISGYKELGLLVIKHTDGNIMSIIDMIIESGFDCIDPIDPIAGMSLKQIKSEYGDRICIKGNVDCSSTLSFKSAKETIEETKNCLDIGMPGGGYILSSSNSILSSVKPENYRAMLETLKQFGQYS
ncbi:MAG: uroporphyrinogen decarboxylase family protein [Candidatus Humimicrobiaceae bacterium]